jgi:hypothetical protein
LSFQPALKGNFEGSYENLTKQGEKHMEQATKTVETYEIDSLECWNDGDGGWDLNAWYKIGEIELPPRFTDLELIQAFIDDGYLKPDAKKQVCCEHWGTENGYIQIQVKKTYQPLWSIRLKRV